MNKYFTIGMAGHIDHGKTTLTKALTGINTDQLKEEKEKNISIEPGFAPFIREEKLEVSIVDVPGHEKFIRQMIAGVAGIDIVILVIAADEGVMPQTKEHLDILSLLGIESGLVVITKITQVDEELFEIILEDVKENLQQTFLEDAPMYVVDSITKKGIPELKDAIREKLLHIEKKDRQASFRLPIDNVFTVKGRGVVVRGTIYDGEVRQGERLKVLPANKEVRVRQIQRHHKQKDVASRGQRTAINLGGITHEEVSRGDVLVADDFYPVSNRIDIVFYPLKDIHLKIKQRQPIKLHIGTSEIMGKIIFFDRNEMNVNENEEVVCQLQLNEEVVVARGDRFILRRPTPVETIGGGWVIDPNAKKYRFGKKTIEQLKLKKEGSSEDRIIAQIEEKIVLTETEIVNDLAISEKEFSEMRRNLLEIEEGFYTLHSIFERVKDKMIALITSFHERYPMRIGINKAEIVSELKQQYPESLLEFTIDTLRNDHNIKISNQFISLAHVVPSLPHQWKTRLENMEKELIKQGVEVEKWSELHSKHHIPTDIQKEFYYFLIQTKKAFVFDDDRLISKAAVDQALRKLKEHTDLKDFTLQTAREILQLTRKNLVPLLELLDYLGYTKRVGNMRTWMISDGA